MEQNIQILLETMLRCGGNCSGCALSSVERMSKSSIDWNFFEQKVKSVNQFLQEKIKSGPIESISLFLGQGDHFLMSEDEMHQFMHFCSQMVPKEVLHKTVILITASAIGKQQQIKEKMDKFFEISLEHSMPFFIQVVFDPKKMMLNDKFKQIYINNILYFKQKCGMTELTINLGNDLFESMSPNEFHQWVKEYKFAHVEMNWVMNNQTKQMWNSHSKVMFEWLIELLEINAQDHTYEINFVPFLARALQANGMNAAFLKKHLTQQLKENIYIDNEGNIALSQAGLVSNLISLKQRLEKQPLSISNITEIAEYSDKTAQNLISKILRRKSCIECEFSQVCSQIGTSAWIDLYEGNTQNCPWDIKGFLKFMETYFKKYPQFAATNFNKNPVQSELLQKDNNATYKYFEEKFTKNNDCTNSCI